MEYYGIEEAENKLFESYLKSRRAFVQIETQRSKVTKALYCSVVEGSLLSDITLKCVYP